MSLHQPRAWSTNRRVHPGVSGGCDASNSSCSSSPGPKIARAPSVGGQQFGDRPDRGVAPFQVSRIPQRDAPIVVVGRTPPLVRLATGKAFGGETRRHRAAGRVRSRRRQARRRPPRGDPSRSPESCGCEAPWFQRGSRPSGTDIRRGMPAGYPNSRRSTRHRPSPPRASIVGARYAAPACQAANSVCAYGYSIQPSATSIGVARGRVERAIELQRQDVIVGAADESRIDSARRGGDAVGCGDRARDVFAFAVDGLDRQQLVAIEARIAGGLRRGNRPCARRAPSTSPEARRRRRAARDRCTPLPPSAP